MVFPNFYLHLLPLFASIQSPNYSLFLPAFLATSLFLITFPPFNTFNCPSLALYPPFLLFVIHLIFWYNLLLIQGLERIVHVTLVCHFTIYFVSSTCKYQEKGVALFSLLSLLLLCQIYTTTTHELTDPTKDFFVGLSLQQPNRQTWVKGSMTNGNTSLEVVRTEVQDCPSQERTCRWLKLNMPWIWIWGLGEEVRRLSTFIFNHWAVSCCCQYWFWGPKGSVFTQTQDLGANEKHKCLTVPIGTDFLLPGDHTLYWLHMCTIYLFLVKTNKT